MNLKKRKSPIVVIMCIFVLALFIILPPTLRAFYPKQEDPTVTKKKDKIETLTCKKTSQEEQYNIVSKIRYINQIPEQNIITYTKTVTETEQKKVAEEATPKTDLTTTPKTVVEELAIFQAIPSLTVELTEAGTIVTITKEDIEENDANPDFLNYLLNIEDQKVYYISQGYTCSTTKPSS